MKSWKFFLLTWMAAASVAQAQDAASEETRARVHTELAAAYFQRAQFGVALEEANIALKALPDYAPAHSLMGLVYMELQDDTSAELHFSKALKAAPADSDINNNYGWFLCQRKREAESIKYFLAAIKNPLYTTPEKSFYNAGLCSLRQGNETSAEEFFQKALRARPGYPAVLLKLAELRFAHKEYDATRLYLTQYLKLNASTPDALWLAIRNERKLGDKDAEASFSLQLRRDFPGSKQARLMQEGRFD